MSSSAFSAFANGEANLTRLLEEADIVPLVMALVHCTGDLSLLDQLQSYVRGPWDHQIKVPETLSAIWRRRLAEELVRLEKCPDEPAAREFPPEIIQRMMSLIAGESVEHRYVPMVLEQMQLAARPEATKQAPQNHQATTSERFRVVIVGAGASGLCAAIRLGQAGIRYVLLEKNADVGGTWYENRYPGCAVDLPSHLYQYSFEPNHEWPRYYSKQQSVFEYLSHCAEKYHVRQHARFGLEVTSANFDESTKCWVVSAQGRDGRVEEFQANAIICAVGLLNRPSIPAFSGLETFKGQKFHTAAWPENADLRGKHVALVGTGASAVQVGPALVDDVASLHVFQRSATWLTRRSNIAADVSDAKKWVIQNVPYYAIWYRFQLFWAFGDAIYDALKIDPEWSGGCESINELNAKLRATMLRYIERQLEGREDLLKKAVPKYPPFGKRVLADTGWYSMLRRPHVRLIETPIDRIERDGIRTADGETIRADAIVFATGFEAGRMLWPMEITGRKGHTIRNTWGNDNPRAYLGITVPNFPNLFVLYGPNTNFAHGGSAIFLAECQVHYILRMLVEMTEGGFGVAEVRKEVHDRYNDLIDAKLREFSWSHPSVNSWYRNSAGRVITNQPWRLIDYWQLTRKPVMTDYRLEKMQ